MSSTAYVYACELSEDLLCPICKQPFVDPVTIVECGCTLCKSCLAQETKQNKVDTSSSCSVCHRSLQTGMINVHAPHKIVLSMLDKLLVKCPHEGCDVITQRSALQEHVEQSCLFKPRPAKVECVLCLSSIDREAVLEHLTSAGCAGLHGTEMQTALKEQLKAVLAEEVGHARPQSKKGKIHPGIIVGEAHPKTAHWTCCFKTVDEEGCQ